MLTTASSGQMKKQTNKQTNLLSCINSDVDVTDGQVQILVVT